MKKQVDRSKQIIQILSLLRHGDHLIMREIAEYMGLTRYTTTHIVQNYRKCFKIHGASGGAGSGQGIKRRYGISEPGKARLREAEGADASVVEGPSAARPYLFTENPSLAYLHCVVFKRPYKELSNTGRHLAKQRHDGEVQG